MSDIPANSDSSFLPTASLARLSLRSKLLQATRQFFYDRGFIEVETPVLSADVVVDRHLDPIEVTLPDDPRRPAIGRRMWLQTSPEFGMKRLLAAGATAIFQVGKVFRAAERGPLHNPEFTMVEWYRPGDDYAAGMQLLSDLAEALLGRGPAEQVTYAEAFAKHVDVDAHRASALELQAAAVRLGLQAPTGLGADRDGWLDFLLVEVIQRHLGVGRPTILCDYPASQAALARMREIIDAGKPNIEVAERFELYVDGIELANGYHELTSAAVLRQRNGTANEARAADGKARLPQESRLLAAMDAGLPPCAGCALGFDRLVMVAAGAETIDEVIALPVERA